MILFWKLYEFSFWDFFEILAPDDATIYFLLGNGTTFNDEILHENQRFGDLLIANFEDTYENLPLKTYAIHQYASENCNSDIPIVIQDDDAFIDYSQIFKENVGEKMLCPMGGVAPMNPKANPNYFRKHWMRVDNWPPQYSLLKYCNGPCTLMNTRGNFQLTSSRKIPFS